MWPKFKTQEEVPGPFRGMYEERDGEWRVKPEHVPEDVTALKGALDKERRAKEDEEKARKKLAGDLDALQKKLQEMETKAAAPPGTTDEQLKALREKVRNDLLVEFGAQLEERDAKIKGLEGMRAENRALKLDYAVKGDLLAAGALGEEIEALFTLSRDDFDLTDDGKPMVRAHPGKPVKLYAEDTLKKRYKWAFQGTQAAGGGAGGHHVGKGGAVITADDVLANPEAALTAARAKGP